MTYLSKEEIVAITADFPSAGFDEAADTPALTIGKDDLLPLLGRLKAGGLDFLADLTAVDYKDHIEVVYHLFSMEGSRAAEVHVDVDEAEPSVPTVTGLFPGAAFEEREAFDLMGVIFTGHEGLSRILLPDNYVGHPLRKDFIPPEPKLEGGKLVWISKNKDTEEAASPAMPERSATKDAEK